MRTLDFALVASASRCLVTLLMPTFEALQPGFRYFPLHLLVTLTGLQ